MSIQETAGTKTLFAIEEIMRNVPHRYPFLLIDRIIAFEPGVSLKALKNVSINEAQFQGHFPGKPVLPGVYIIENMAQASCFLLIKSAGGGVDNGKVYYLGRVKNATFKKPVVPGDQLVSEVTIVKQVGDSAIVEARATVDGELVAKAEMMFGAGAA